MLYPVTFFVLMILERILPGYKQPSVRWWTFKGIAFSLGTGWMAAMALPLIGGKLLHGRSLLHLDRAPLVVGILAVWVVPEFFLYWEHRLAHKIDFLWRWTHQLHHASERMDMAGQPVSHPFDLVIIVTIRMTVVTLLGASPLAVVVGNFLSYIQALFEHLNVRTPKWLGYVLQRPESHSLHHARGIHAYNYGLPIFDILFGTFRNVDGWQGPSGFWDGASRHVVPMLLGRDVSTPDRVEEPATTTRTAG